MICSSNEDLEKELNHLEAVFCDINEYPRKTVKAIIEEERRKQNDTVTESAVEEEEGVEEDGKVTFQINLPFAGLNGENLVKKMRNEIRRKSESLKLRVTYTPKKLGSRFIVKDKTKDKHQHNVTYHLSCGNKKCSSNYVGQTKQRTMKRTLDHNSRDKASHVLAHSKKTKHRRVYMENLKILGRGYKSDFKRKISESLFIKELKPDLNKQKDAFKLKLFN